ncbi:hypothetical protein O7602_12935 [Micromonospora sp. WMMD1128]|uniref:hypothetical protein n=1 Tax=unclassified Micromonospora TaxID=2617518 RepID=UPI00248B775E|nr:MULTISPECIES: hypothetical protein [unclassified Micromonospora]WBB76375.1 hypothetical protein O7602_12935 [Micromonospora sp. WMMD1128]WFE35840.1 hypothetical protein O7613_10820 [Micromonospora sp. WMMD975]
MAEFRRAYGAAAWHLLLLVGCFAVTGWIALRLAGEPTAGRMLLWFLGAVIAHDLVLFPLYAALDRALRRAGPSLRNHVRVPAYLSALLFGVYLPTVLGLGDGTYAAATGLSPRPLLGRWLAVTAVLFAASAAHYAIRRPRRR